MLSPLLGLHIIFILYKKFKKLIVNFDGKELTVCGGGRYDGLVEYFDGPATPAFGFGLGIERLLMIAEKQEIN